MILENYLQYIQEATYRTITFPRIEQADIKKRLKAGKEVQTVRCSAHYKRFKLNQICKTQWGDLIIITKVTNVNKPKELSNYDKMTKKMKDDINTYCEPGKIEDIRFKLYNESLIRKWIKEKVPKNPPKDNKPYGRCITYAAALATIFKGKLIKGKNIKMHSGDTSHFWTIINEKEYDPTGHWYSGGKNIEGKEVNMIKNKNFFDKDPIYQKLIKEL